MNSVRKKRANDDVSVRHRLLLLRRDHPDARVQTELVELDRERGFALFRASIEIPGGGSATAYGSETEGDFRDYIEKAETKALGRALRALGYSDEGTEDASPATDKQRNAIASLCARYQIDPAALVAARDVQTREQASHLIDLLQHAHEPVRSGDAAMGYLAQVADRFELTLAALEQELRAAGRLRGDWSSLRKADVLWAEARAYQLASK
uniref:Uncharacterized protein n=2 Tax=Thermorudis TaxID=1649508 RepID=A0A7C2WAT7_9BACT